MQRFLKRFALLVVFAAVVPPMSASAGSVGGAPSAATLASSWLATMCAGIPAPLIHPDVGTDGFSVEPPAGFDPQAGTDDQLKCYGLPPRPRDAAKLSHWTWVVEHARKYVVPVRASNPTVQVPSNTPTYYTCENGYGGCDTHNPNTPEAPWGGYAAYTGNNTQYPNLSWYSMGADFTVPYAHTYCNGAAVDVWDGIGGDGWDGTSNEDIFLQNGTISQNESYGPLYYWFWLTNATAGHLVWSYFTSPSISPGDYVVVGTYYSSSTQTVTFSFMNDSTGEGTDDIESVPAGFSPSSVEDIVEDHPGPDYVNFGSVEFGQEDGVGSYGSNQTTSGYITAYNDSKFVTYNWNIKPSGGSVSYPVNLQDGDMAVDADGQNDTC